MQSGKVKFFNEAKGFGFIIADGSNEEIFVHVSGLVDKTRENDQVTFEVEQERKKARMLLMFRLRRLGQQKTTITVLTD